MQTIYSEHHHLHHPQLEFFEGRLSKYQDTPERAQIILDAVRDAQLGDIRPPEDAGLEPILAVHHAHYIHYMQHAYANWIADGGVPDGVYPDTFPVNRAPHDMRHRPTRPGGLAGYYSMDLTAILVAGTWDAAYHAAQCALTAADLARRGERAVFALCRPPGHHAHADLCGGYCFLNNAAIAAHALTRPANRPTGR